MLQPPTCDYCATRSTYGLHNIPLTRTPNGETIKAQLCQDCLKDIAAYIDEWRKAKEK